MRKNMLSKALIATLISSSLLLVACDDDDKQSSNTGQQQVQKETLTGITATGAALVGADIEVVGKTGKTAKTKTVDGGKFTVEIEPDAPYMIKASKGDTVLYSYSAQKGYVNITQLTTQAVLAAYDNGNITTLYKDWVTLNNKVTQAKIDDAAKKVAANLETALKAELTAEKVDVKKLNIFTQVFEANSKGFDAILDDVKVNYSCNVTCTVEYKIKDAAYNWNYNISTDGYTWVINNPNGPAGSGQNCLVEMDYSYKISISGVANQSGAGEHKFCYENFPQNAACAAGNQSLKNIVQASAMSGQLPGFEMTISKYEAKSVASCPAGVQKGVYQ